jgi:hypothetical protein
MLSSVSLQAGVRTYGGGGYVFRFTGQIHDLEAKMQSLIENNWVDNRTRALLLEFSVYNAQVFEMVEFCTLARWLLRYAPRFHEKKSKKNSQKN